MTDTATPLGWSLAGAHPLVASAAAVVKDADRLLNPPAQWFALDPTLPDETPFSVLPDGRVYGLVSRWDTPHIGYNGQLVYAPRDPDGGQYRYFKGGKSVIADGGLAISTGVLYMNTVHPDLAKKASDTQTWYADTGAAVADVAVYETNDGIVVAGRIRPSATAEQIIALRGSDVSPDWRPVNGRLHMVGLLACNVSGFPGELPLVASAGGGHYVRPGKYAARFDTATGEPLAIVAAGMVHHRLDYDALERRLRAVESFAAGQRAERALRRLPVRD